MKSENVVFDAYSKYYDALYKDKDYVAEVNYVDTVLQANHIQGPRILELGCGTGKHGKLLTEKGYQVHGIERSIEMVRQANPVNGFTIQQGDICSVRLDRTFDAVISLFHVVSYQITNLAINDLFSRVSEHLLVGGLFMFDVWYSPAVYEQRPSVRLKRIAAKDLEIIRVAEPVMVHNENRVDVNYSMFIRDVSSGVTDTFSESHRMRHFSALEIDALAASHNFQVILAEEFLTGANPSETTWGVCFVLRKLQN